MASPFLWHFDPGPNETRLVIGGDITENSDFAEPLRDAKAPLVLDLADVCGINSCGVREWIHFVAALDKAGISFRLERCSIPIVHQLSMIANFAGKGEVRSVFAPFFCPACRAEVLRLVDVAKDPLTQLEPGELCPTCGATTEFDDIPESYFAFRARS